MAFSFSCMPALHKVFPTKASAENKKAADEARKEKKKKKKKSNLEQAAKTTPIRIKPSSPSKLCYNNGLKPSRNSFESPQEQAG
ncbi:hypothetical protein Cni_G23025 [Canna indica]|uniref:Uncharacterized protein n=1 Tax=Canna indica TaxID=4628 RepID=A0AAQ3KT91_9LILI|nr:hypothetical protein Cni_G23025 [Canna indica]